MFARWSLTARAVKLGRTIPQEPVVTRYRLFSLQRAVLACTIVLIGGPALAHAPGPFTPRPAGASHDARPAEALYLNNRHIVTFRAPLLGDSPTDRALLAGAALDEALKTTPPAAATVTHSLTGDSVRFQVNERTVFFLIAQDAGTPRPETALVRATQEVQGRLEKAVQEAAELRDRLRMASDMAICLGISLAAWLLVSGTLRLRRLASLLLNRALRRLAQKGTRVRPWWAFSEHAHVACRLVTNGAAWGAVLLILDTWITLVLLQFAWTRPWGEQSSHWLLGVLHHFASEAIAALPGLAVVGLIFLIASMVSHANAAFMNRVQCGDLRLPWLRAHAALPTRRLCDTVLWLFAVAMAYPYLPGAETEAFKALSVMTGLMLSLGASSAVGQAFAGLRLMYSHSLRVGQRVRIGNTEGTVVMVGMFTTTVQTALGEDVFLPNKMIVNKPVRHLPASHGVQEPDQPP